MTHVPGRDGAPSASGEVLSNPRSDRVRTVRKLSGRSARLRAGRFLVEGPQAVREAVAAHAGAVDRGDRSAPGAVRELYATPAAAERHADVLAQAAAAGIPARPVTAEVLAGMTGEAGAVTPQGLLAVCDLVTVPLERALAAAPRLVAVLAHVRDPGNAGTVIRAADAAGAGAVVLAGDTVDVHNAKCVRSTAGSLFHLPVVAGVPVAEAVAGLRAAGLRVLAADVAGPADLDELLDDAAGPLTGPVAWLFGNEAWGLPDADLGLADLGVRVPVYGAAESLNLAMAATVCLYATARAQRRG